MRIYLMNLLAGLFFGIWPLFMKHSGIRDFAVSTIVMESVVLVVVILAGFRSLSGIDLASTNWLFLVLSGVSAALGVLAFNNGMATVGEQGTSVFIVFTMLVQLCVTAGYQVWLAGGLTSSQTIGFTFAGIAVYFLSK